MLLFLLENKSVCNFRYSIISAGSCKRGSSGRCPARILVFGFGKGGLELKSSERRDRIRDLLEHSDQPVSASAIAEKFHVSRQIIVGDIALLRAADVQIFATPRGYMMKPEEKPSGKDYMIACRHRQDQIAQELYAVVDNGGQVLDVIVEHAVYGQISGQLQLSSRYDVDCFVRKLEEGNSAPLSQLTEGIHLHTIRCPDDSCFQRILAQLRQSGILFHKP